MSGLSALRLVQTKREKGSSPQHARRHAHHFANKQCAQSSGSGDQPG